MKYKKDVLQSLERQFPEYKPAISRGVIRELSKMAKNQGKKGAMARFALMALKAKNVEVHNMNTTADRWILDSAPKTKHSIAITNDTELAMQLKWKGISSFKISKSGMLKHY